MYKIGEFSKITNLTVKALRYYDEQEILKPSCRGENGYRLYNDRDFTKAQRIVFLRSFKFSIAEIKEAVENCEDEEDLKYFLTEKKSFILQHIENEKALINDLDRCLQSKNKEVNIMEYKIEIKEFDEINVASIRFKGSYSDVGKYIGNIYKVVKNNANGAPFNCYFDGEFKEIADIELCVPIKKIITSKEVVSKQLPKINAICTTHIGSYETLNFAYKALMDYARENNIKSKIPSREIYHNGPGMIFKGNPNKYVTEIIIPIEEEA